MTEDIESFFEVMHSLGLQDNIEIAKAFDKACPNQLEKSKKTDLIKGVSNFNKFFKSAKLAKQSKQPISKHEDTKERHQAAPHP